MKKLYSICIILFLAFTGHQVLAQQIGDLKGIHFQAVAIDDMGKEIVGMDINGKPVYNKTIGVRFSILKGNSGPVLYQETHSTLTDQHGLFSLVIGEGRQTSEGAHTRLMDIPWIEADQFLKVEISLKNDNNYKMVSLQQFMAVPYSFYTDDIADDAITTAKILNEEILSEDIKNETILAEDIKEGAIETSEILNETIIAEDIAEGAVTTAEILDETIVNEDIANATIDLTAKVTGTLPVANGGTGVDNLTDGGLLVGGGTTPVRALPAATDRQIAVGVTGADPELLTLTQGAGIVINEDTDGNLVISSSVQGVNTQSVDITVGQIAAGTTFISTPIHLDGVVPGDFVVGSYSANLQGCILTAYVFSNDNIKVAIYNGNQNQKNLGSGTLRILLIK